MRRSPSAAFSATRDGCSCFREQSSICLFLADEKFGVIFIFYLCLESALALTTGLLARARHVLCSQLASEIYRASDSAVFDLSLACRELEGFPMEEPLRRLSGVVSLVRRVLTLVQSQRRSSVSGFSSESLKWTGFNSIPITLRGGASSFF